MHDKNDPMGLIQEDPELFVRPKLDDGKQKSFLPGGGGGGLPESECRAERNKWERTELWQ